MVSTKELAFCVGKQFLVKPTSINFEEGKFHVVMGPNGAGKSTLLKLLAGDSRPTQGSIVFDNKDLQSYTKKELALKRAVLSQHYTINFPITVKEIVMMGRYPHYNLAPTEKDKAIGKVALQLFDLEKLSDRDYNTLSGGEAQKVQMSRVWAQLQQPGNTSNKLLYLDEPVSHLDIKYQHQLLQVAKEICQKNTTVIAILHDINLALRFASTIYFMKEGEVIEILTNPGQISTATIEKVYRMPCRIFYEDKKPVVVF